MFFLKKKNKNNRIRETYKVRKERALRKIGRERDKGTETERKGKRKEWRGRGWCANGCGGWEGL